MSPFGVRAALVLAGFTAAAAQIALMRELIVVSGGNEIAIGLVLASWLLWTAVGSSVLGRFIAFVRDPRRLMAGLEALLALALPLTILAVRAFKAALQTVPGESLGPASTLLAALATLSLVCALSGALFAAGSRLCGDSPGEATGSAYLLEALGSAAGGAVAGLFLVRYSSSLQTAWILAALNLLAASCLTFRNARARCIALIAIAPLLALAWLPFGVPSWETISLQRLWPPGYRLLAARNSISGSLAVVETEGSRTLYENGLPLFHAPDPESAEESVHYALLEHPAPRRLLLIGGGMNGALAEALRHPSLERADYVELDPAILELARRYFPDEWSRVESDPRVRVYAMDGRRFLKTTRSAFDVVIVSLPDPQTAQLNRFYTLEFFREAAAKLNPGGVLSFRLSGSETYIGPDQAEFLRSIRKTLGMVFPEIAVLPGESIHFFAADRPGVLARNAGELLARLRERRLNTTYVREYYLPFRMTPDRVQELEREIAPRPETRVNRDFTPVAYYFNIALWSSQFHPRYAAFFRNVAGVPFSQVAAALAIVLATLAVAMRRRPRAISAWCTASLGFTSLGLEVLLLLAFQAIYGYVYQQLAIVIAAFMAGMAIGAWRGRVGQALWPARWVSTQRTGRKPGDVFPTRALSLPQLLAALAPLTLCALFELAPRLASPILFAALALACGMIGGYQFPIASRIFFSGGKRNLGALYAVDLAGSCLGAILFSAWLIPVFGFVKTAVLAAELNLVPAAVAYARRTPGP